MPAPSSASSSGDSSAAAIAPLLTRQGWELLGSLGPYDEANALALSESLRRAGHPAELVSAVLTQSRLRSKARAKFGEFAQRMLFTEAGLEQATRLSVAAHHAQRYVGAGIEHIADLGCGIGADSMAFATLDRRVTAVDQDETTAAVATVNLSLWPEAVVSQAVAQDVDLSAVDGVWLDPARRRSSGPGASGPSVSKRLFDPESFSPPFSFVTGLAERRLAVGAKLGPALDHEAIPAGVEAQWTSVDGSLGEVALWFNALARPSVARSAVVVGGGTTTELTSPVPYDPQNQDIDVVPLGRYLLEPDGAVIRAGLVADAGARLNAGLICPQIAYLSTDELPQSPLVKAYAVREVLPLHTKTLKSWVRSNRVGTLEIKKRGVSQTPEQMRRDLAPKGPNSATLILTRMGPTQKRVAIVADPVRA